MIKTKDEEEWIGLNLQSLKDFADEIVVVDSSTDRTPEIIEEVASEYNLNLRLIRYEVDGWVKTKEHAELSNIALRNTSFRWVVRWEGDFIASDSIMKIKEDILNSNPNIYHVISFPTVNLDGDIFHQNKGGELNIEARPHTYSDALMYKDIRQYEVLRVPLWYKPSYKYVLKGEYFIFHMGTVKNARRLLFRYFWLKWRKTNDYNRFPRIEDYVGYGIKKDWGVDNIEEAVRYYMNEILCKSLVPYDKSRFGEYPELLKKELENPRYKVIYKDGKIIGRNDTL
jgi:glycosyltransferase involved in cell wall biosynthesis